jgi:hypothetical protein
MRAPPIGEPRRMPPASSFFDQLLLAARAQAEPQRLLFVFAQSELPPHADARQRADYVSGRGGALTPLVCVDKPPGELSTFETLAQESREACPPWHVVFIAALGGQNGREPAAATVENALKRMVENVRAGRFAGYMALDARGEPLLFT